MMRTKLLAAAGLAGLLILAGCAGTGSSETEQLKQQIAQLEQQVTELENGSTTTETQDAGTDDMTADTTADAAADTSTDTAANTTTDTAVQTAEGASAGNTAETVSSIEDLTAKVDEYVRKVDADAASSGQKTLENYFTLKQEEEAIDHELEYYEDDLEYQYRNGSLTRDEYREKERELDLLEDKLDAAEDTLEYVYGIDD